MKKFLLLCTLVFSLGAMAQSPGISMPPSVVNNTEATVQKKVSKLATELKLTESQKGKLTKGLTDLAEERKKIGQSKMPVEAQTKALQAVAEKERNLVKTLLTREQYVQFMQSMG